MKVAIKPLIIITSHRTLKNIKTNFEATIMLYPETKKHPSKHIAIARDIVLRVRSGERIVLITHSDYIVKELNNCIMLGHAGDLEDALDYVNLNLVPSEHYTAAHVLNSSDVACYIIEDAPREVAVDKEYGMEASAFDAQIISIDKAANTLARLIDADKYGFISTVFDSTINNIVDAANTLAQQVTD